MHTLSTTQLLEEASLRAIAYLDSLKNRPVRPDPDAVARLSELDVPVPEKPTAPGEVLAQLDQFISPATMAMAGPRFFGFVIGGSLPVTLAANWLAGAWDQNTGLHRSDAGRIAARSRSRCAGCWTCSTCRATAAARS